MLGAGDHHRSSGCERGARSVGAGIPLVPGGSFEEIQGAAALAGLRVCEQPDDQPLWIDERDEMALASKAVVDRMQQRVRDFQKTSALDLTAKQHQRIVALATQARGIQPEDVAAFPGLTNYRASFVRCHPRRHRTFPG